jgi:hypothetical protein
VPAWADHGDDRGRPTSLAALVAANLAWALVILTAVLMAVTIWLDRLLRQTHNHALTWLTAGNAVELGAAVSAAAVGVVLASRRPCHPVGWILLGMAVSITIASSAFVYRAYGLVMRPGSLPGASYVAGIANGFVILWLSCAGFVLLLTPTGSLPSPRWRWWARISADAAAVFVLASAVSSRPMYPESTRRSGTRLASGPSTWHRWVSRFRSPPSSSWSGWSSGPHRWSPATVAPAGSIASSSAGWRWRARSGRWPWSSHWSP